MRRLIGVGAVALALSACAQLAAFVPASGLPPSGSAVDLGGDVALRAGAVAELVLSGQPYAAATECSSACAMLTGVPAVCWDPDGWVAVHSARATPEAAQLLGLAGKSEAEVIDGLNQLQASFMSPILRAMFLAPGGPADTRSTELVYYHNSELIAAGDIQPCRET